MELFDKNNHLTDIALQLLLADDLSLSQLDRLEIAEHLSYCDECLTRYTNMLTDNSLVSPPEHLKESVWRRIRLRAIKVLTSRWATAAAAIAIVFALWGGGVFSGLVSGTKQAAAAQISISQQLGEGQSWCSDAMENILGGINNVFGIFSNNGGSGETGSRIQTGGLTK